MLQGRARLQAATVTVGETPAMSPGNMLVKETYHYTIYNINTANPLQSSKHIKVLFFETEFDGDTSNLQYCAKI